MYATPRNTRTGSLGFLTEIIAAVAPTVIKAVQGGNAPETGGDVFAGVTNPGQPTEGAKLVVERANATQLATLRAAMCEDGGRMAVDRKDALGLAWYVSGGADGIVTTSCGKRLVVVFNTIVDQLRQAVVSGQVPAAPDYTLPGIEVTVPRGAGQVGGMLALAALVGLVMFAPKRRARR